MRDTTIEDGLDAEAAQADGGIVGPKLVLGVVAIAALAAFIFQNTQDAEVNFLVWTGTIPLYLLLLITVALSGVAVAVGSWLLRRR